MSQRIGYVVIGRNEGERLKACIRSLPPDAPIIYVDSGSSDGSPAWVRDHGVPVHELSPEQPFTAARARNEGFRELMQRFPEIAFVQFIDGDCELHPDWPASALSFLESHPEVCAAFGRRRERFRERSIYNRLCDIEWDVPLGPAKAFGGDVMLRAKALSAAGGYRSDLIAGEEPELCVRLRASGWQIHRLPAEMTSHDAAITNFGQWWRRVVRSGHAFAEGAFLHGRRHGHWLRETARAVVWGALLPLACLIASVAFWPAGLVAWLIYPLQMLRLWLRAKDPERTPLAVFHVLARFPEAEGVMWFALSRLRRRRSGLIEYKV
ncbi:MAG: glycosyltransferase [Bradyrhizobium sp.]|uniref:glycosyltransferase family 2 protein n=1 Tax=Bradyrhizobium sp. TaxID=376 RepID=UPI0025BBF9FF|nr:glycosyltransferase [Bradyrhizobium sp.]MBI5263399.1 glycosyltransferase [Bradyrhizobium sp.]